MHGPDQGRPPCSAVASRRLAGMGKEGGSMLTEYQIISPAPDFCGVR